MLPIFVDENLSYLCEWENFFDGDTIDFDYHLMWDHILDAGGEGIARVIHDDIINFESLGMNGYISCQLQRNAFPTSVAMTVMGKTLWSSKTDFDATRKKLYANSFGEENADNDIANMANETPIIRFVNLIFDQHNLLSIVVLRGVSPICS